MIYHKWDIESVTPGRLWTHAACLTICRPWYDLWPMAQDVWAMVLTCAMKRECGGSGWRKWNGVNSGMKPEWSGSMAGAKRTWNGSDAMMKSEEWGGREKRTGSDPNPIQPNQKPNHHHPNPLQTLTYHCIALSAFIYPTIKNLIWLTDWLAVCLRLSCLSVCLSVCLSETVN